MKTIFQFLLGKPSTKRLKPDYTTTHSISLHEVTPEDVRNRNVARPQDAGTDLKEVFVEVYDAGRKKVLSSSEKAQALSKQIELTKKKGTLQLPIDDTNIF